MASSAEFNVSCSFCDEGFTSEKKLAEHLMMCGNKTDQCPNCQKFIRRAIFAYHYENECADFDEPPSEKEKPNKPQSSNGIRVDVRCPHCNENYDKNVDKNHRKNCRLNPDNLENGHNRPLYPNLDRTSDPSNNSDDDFRIPCEWCGQGVPFHLFENHSKACRDHEHRRLEEKLRAAEQSKPNQSSDSSPHGRLSSNKLYKMPVAAFAAVTNAIEYAFCKFCTHRFSSQGLRYHEMHCVKNAHRNKN